MVWWNRRQPKQALLAVERILPIYYPHLLHTKICCSNFALTANSLYVCPGSLILEMGALSHLTGDPRFESAALRSLRKLWSMRSSLNLLGTTLDVKTGEWIDHSSGIGAGILCSRMHTSVWILIYLASSKLEIIYLRNEQLISLNWVTIIILLSSYVIVTVFT